MLDKSIQTLGAEQSKNVLFTKYVGNQQVFLDFVLSEYVKEGVGELDAEKLPDLLRLKYGGVRDAQAALGNVGVIKEIFTEFQGELYEKKAASS